MTGGDASAAPAVPLREARAADWPQVRVLLEGAGLPHADLGAADMGGFLVADGGGQVVGAVGLEYAGDVGLLRSLVVATSLRGHAVGSRLVAAIEARARELGVAELWLLTIDAGEFFASRGYRRRQRDSAPGPIRDSAEFSSLCPADAALYSKQLRSG